MIYVAFVLVLSGLTQAKADSVVIPAHNATLEADYLRVSGLLPSACYQSPVIEPASIDSATSTVALRVVSQTTPDVFCTMAMSPYQVVFSLQSLNLDAGKNYSITFVDSDVPSINYEPRNIEGYTGEYFKTVDTWVGEMTATEQPGVLELNSGVEKVFVQVENLDLSLFLNRKIKVIGHPVATGQIDPFSTDPLPSHFVIPIMISGS